MKLNPQLLDQLRRACAAVEASPIQVLDLDFYPGAAPHSVQPSLVCHLEVSGSAGTMRAILETLQARYPGRFDAPQAAATADKVADADSIAALAAELAARLVASQRDMELGWGAGGSANGHVTCWTEYFPGGADYNRVLAPYRALKCALVAIAEAASPDQTKPSATAENLRQLSNTLSLQPFHAQSLFLINAARRRNIPVLNVGSSPLAWQFGWGSRSETFFLTASSGDGAPGHQCTRNKAITKAMFRDLGLPTPNWQVLGKPGEALAAANAVGWPCVVKPLGEGHGEGVTAGIADAAQLEAAVSRARAKSPFYMVEEHEPGADYRLMVVEGCLVAAVRREPPFVIGDGRSSVGELVARLNERRRGTAREAGYLSPVSVDAALECKLSGQGLSLGSVLAAGDRLTLRSVANRSAGGSAVDVTAELHPQVRQLAEMLANTIGLRTAGIDYITTDISRSPAEAGGGFIEVNAMPGLGALMAAGRPEEEIASLVLGERPGRVPVTLVVGSGDLLANVRRALLEEIAAAEGAAMVAPGSARVGSVALPLKGLDSFGAINAVLRYRSVDTLTIVWPLDEIYRYGVPVDRIDRIVVLGPPPAGEWLSLLHRLCSDLVFAPDVDGAVTAASAAPLRSSP